MASGTGGQHALYVKQYLPTASPAYQKPKATERDVLPVLSTFKDLRPRMDTYMFNDGSKKTLLCIDGTIPTYYKGTSYNIPICIWVMETHPFNPPLCFVKPTKDMLIKPSKYVDSDGKVYLPYLYDWKYPSSDLLGLIQVMSAVFGELSPVFCRTAQLNPPRPTQYPSTAQTPYNPSAPSKDEDGGDTAGEMEEEEAKVKQPALTSVYDIERARLQIEQERLNIDRQHLRLAKDIHRSLVDISAGMQMVLAVICNQHGETDVGNENE